MLHEQTVAAAPAREEQQPESREDFGRALKASAPRHPALGRVHVRLTSSPETEAAISRYDRMHHRHSRS
jgi:hypothetical protein